MRAPDSEICFAVTTVTALGALGIGSTVFQRALIAQAQPAASVTPEMVKQAEWIAGLNLSEEDRKTTAQALQRLLGQLQTLRQVKLDNGVAPDAWIPFGGGKRRCVGSHLAMLELRTAVAEVIRRLDVRPANPEPERTRLHHVTLTPADGGRVVVSPRRSGEAPQLRLRSPDRRARTAGAPAPARTAPAPARGPGA